jgi:hypothetical protein
MRALVVAMLTGGVAFGAGPELPTGSTVSVCLRRNKTHVDSDTRRPVGFSLTRGAGKRLASGQIGDDENKCVDVAPGAVTLELDLPATEIAASRPCRRKATWQARIGHPLQLFVSRPRLGGDERCPWVFGGGEDEEPVGDDVEKDFVVLPAVESYSAARKLASNAVVHLGLKLDLRDAKSDGRGGLTFSRATCAANDWDYPCFVARGRYDDGAYVSIDEVRRFSAFSGPGYLVILASGRRGDRVAREVLEKAHGFFPKAAITTDKVSHRCIH